MPRVLVAPDKFKGSLTASQVADALRRGIESEMPAAGVASVPVADGGDGTLDAFLAAGFERVDEVATGPTGEPVRTAYARLGDRAVVEMAAVSGLGRLPDGRLQPLTAGSRGTGELIAAAVRAGCRDVVVGIGGSASTDGGAGLVEALGARLYDASGNPLAPGGAALADLHAIDLSGVADVLGGASITVASDVDNPLLGDHGAAAVYGPQKGADAEQVRGLDAALRRWADVVAETTGVDLRDAPGAGAAGGVGFAVMAVLGGRLEPGIDLLLDLLDFDAHLRGVDLVVVGEGSLDEQSLRGKAPIGVARRARAAGSRVVAVCGRCEVDAGALERAGIARAYALTDLDSDPRRCMSEAAALTEALGRVVARQELRHLSAASS
jgi:glycerate 2-kinase